MKSELDNLMRDRGFDAIVVSGPREGNHVLHYLTNGAKVSHAVIVKKQGEEPVLICNAMEREEAAKSGLEVVTTSAFNLSQLIEETGSLFEAELKMMAAIFERYGITGTVCYYGVGDPGKSFVMLSRLNEMLPDVTITGETGMSLFDEAYTLKDDRELEALKDVAARTNVVMGEMVDFLKGHAVKDDHLVKADGSALTIGDVKAYLKTRLLHYNLEDDNTTIFAIGRDAGIPHSRGEDADVLALGKSIIFDLFPHCVNTGYYHDMTRTYSLGYATPEVQKAYDEVKQAFDAAVDALEIGKACSTYQELTCDVFEEHGHKTPRSHPGTDEGYVHSLGHGLGLQIHSHPRLSAFSSEVMTERQAFTIEPGLYYPDLGYGVRIEDTFYVDDNGEFLSLSTYPKDLVIPVG